MANFLKILLFLFVSGLISVCKGEMCTYYRDSIFGGSYYETKYCIYGCCGYNRSECCTGQIGLIVGLCVGGAVFLFFLILTICLCRRRRYAGLVYRNQPVPGTVIVQQSHMTDQYGVVNTSGVPPGVVYPPYQPDNPSAPFAPAPGYPPAYSAVYPSYPPANVTEPPKYETLNFQADGGITNRGFNTKN